MFCVAATLGVRLALSTVSRKSPWSPTPVGVLPLASSTLSGNIGNFFFRHECPTVAYISGQCGTRCPTRCRGTRLRNSPGSSHLARCAVLVNSLRMILSVHTCSARTCTRRHTAAVSKPLSCCCVYSCRAAGADRNIHNRLTRTVYHAR